MAATGYIQQLIAFLEKPSSYAHEPEKVILRQTHASIVAIAPPFVYKVKKPVNLGFLDFTTLEARKANCERELHLNSRLCPQLYKGVVPICMKVGQLHFGPGRQVMDYALQMHQLTDGFFLDQLLQQEQVTTVTLEPVLEILKRFYVSQPEQPSLSVYGDILHIRTNAEENFTTLGQYVPDTVQPEALHVIRYFVDTFLENNTSLLEKRTREHHIKDCHGDLHLDHIHIRDGHIYIYDCIEFNDRFRYMDVAADIAFLAMDLDFNGRPDLSAFVVNQMASLLDDPDMLLLINFYKCYRACVRAKVESIQSAETEVPAETRQTSYEKAIRYMQLALQNAVFGSQPAVIMVCGRIGSGKSTWAKHLAALLGCAYLSSDRIRKEQASLPIYERTDPQNRQWLYSREKTHQVYQALLHSALAQVKKGRNIVVDATFGHPEHRSMFIQAMNTFKVQYFFCEMQASDEVVRARLAGREKRPEVISDARLEDFEKLSHTYQEPVEIAPKHLLHINAEAPITETLPTALCRIIEIDREI